MDREGFEFVPDPAASRRYVDPGLELPAGDLWVFGYGSLMWRPPEFPVLEAGSARLHGYHRALCVWSWVHRGREDHPGLVMGLDLGGSCIGRALCFAARDKAAVADYLYGREMVTPVYLPRLRRVHLAGGSVIALTFLVDRGHPQYAGKLGVAAAARVVRGAVGESGHNRDYILNMAGHLEELGIADGFLRRLRAEIQRG